MIKLFFPLRLESIKDLAIAVRELAQRSNALSIAQDKLVSAPPATPDEGDGGAASDVEVSSTVHGLAPQSPGDPTKFLNGDHAPAYARVKDTDLTLSDNTTNDVSSVEHGFAPKSPADATKFLSGAATPGYAHVKDSDLALTDILTNDVSTTEHGFAPKLPNDATRFLDGLGNYTVPSGNGVGAFVLPVSAGFSWINQGTATLVDTAGEYSLLSAPAAGGRNARLRVKATPATPYTITIYFALEASPASSFPDGGLVLRESSSGKLVRLTVTTQGGSTPVVFIAKETSPTVFSAAYALGWATAYQLVATGAVLIPMWLRITDDGTNRKSYASADGSHWHLVHSVARTDFITPDQYGFGANPDNAGSGMRVFHWAET